VTSLGMPGIFKGLHAKMSTFEQRKSTSTASYLGSRAALTPLMELYIHPLYVLVSKILSSILNSSVLIHPLYHPLSILSTVGLTCHFI
jgi:hypothetical protein